MSIPNKAKGTIRTLKNMTFNYTEIQKKVRTATSNDTVGPNAALLSEIARASFNHHNFVEIMEIVDKRLDDSGKNWRHVFKVLTLIEYMIQYGSDEALNNFKANLYRIKTLREFQYIDEQGRDQGANVRHKAKSITELLLDDAKLKEMRKDIKGNDYGGYGSNNYANSGGFGSTGYASGGKTYNDSNYGYGSSSYGGNNGSKYGYDEDRELQMALEESRKMAQPVRQNSDKDLEYALELSRREAEKESQLKELSIAKENELVLLEDYDPTAKSNNPNIKNIKQYDFFGNLVHDPQPNSSGTADLLGLDPLAFSSHNSSTYNQSYSQNSFSSNQSFVQSNPFAQTNISQPPVTNIFQISPQPQNPVISTPPPSSGSGFNTQFNNSFDGGFKAKLLPHQKENNANSALAAIARNSSKIDPFASFAAERDRDLSPASNNAIKHSNSTGNLFAQGNINSNPFQSNLGTQGTDNNIFSSFNNQPSGSANLFGNSPSSNNPPSSLNIFDPPKNNQNTNPFSSFNNNQPNNQQASNIFQTSNNANSTGSQQNIFF